MSVTYSNWPALEAAEQLWETAENSRQREVARFRRGQAVQAALERIPAQELLVVRRHHFEGKTFLQIAGELGTSSSSVSNQYYRALRRLKRLLVDFARAEFGLLPNPVRCVICNSPARQEIDRLLAARKPGESFGPFMRSIRARYGVNIISPMTIISHLKYHE